MKTSIVTALGICLALKTAAQVQYVTLFATNLFPNPVQYPLQTNQVVSWVGSYQASVYGHNPSGIRIDFPAPTSCPIQVFTGLTNVGLYGVNATSFATLQITTPASANVISNYVPADAIVIPASGTGNVQIILESSADLVNWTAANPGTYGLSSATNRFFRVRAALN